MITGILRRARAAFSCRIPPQTKFFPQRSHVTADSWSRVSSERRSGRRSRRWTVLRSRAAFSGGRKIPQMWPRHRMFRDDRENRRPAKSKERAGIHSAVPQCRCPSVCGRAGGSDRRRRTAPPRWQDARSAQEARRHRAFHGPADRCKGHDTNVELECRWVEMLYAMILINFTM